MHADWEYAHTSYSTPTSLPSPSGLTDSEAQWRHHLETQTPNGRLLRDNAMLQTLASGAPIHLLHLTRDLAAVRNSGHIYASTGCLVGAVYGSPLTPAGRAFRPHNLGSYLLESRRDSTPLIIEVTPAAPTPAKGIDYLRLGAIHLRTYRKYRHFLTKTEDDQVLRSIADRVRVAAPFLDTLLHNASGGTTQDGSFIDSLAAKVPVFPYLGYLYFETVAEYLMLHSTSRATREYADRGEMNNRLYKDLAFSAVQGMGVLFDLGRFGPDHARLLELVERIEAGLTTNLAGYVRHRMSHLFASTALAPEQDASTFSFRRADLNTLADGAPSLLGQLIFREIRILDRYPLLYHCFEQAKALGAWDYWNTERIATPFNGISPKGEIGINPACSDAVFAVWTAKTCDRGLLHPVEQVTAAPAPRLVPWLVATLRDRTEEKRWEQRHLAPA